MQKKESRIKKLNLYANYFLMVSIIAALFGYFSRAAIKSLQSILFLIFFALFFLTAGYVAIKYRVMFNFVSMPVEQQPKRKINNYLGYLFMSIGILLIYAIIKTAK